MSPENQCEAQAEMPRYVSNKIVHALHIAGVEIHKDKSATITFVEKGFGPLLTRPGWAERFAGDENDLGVYVSYEDGFSSWSPTSAFKKGYRQITGEGLSFGVALEELKAGRRVWRRGWNGKGMWLIMVPGTERVRPVAGTPYSKAGLTEETDINPHIDMFTADGKMQPGWLASQTDMLAEDWCSDRVI